MTIPFYTEEYDAISNVLQIPLNFVDGGSIRAKIDLSNLIYRDAAPYFNPEDGTYICLFQLRISGGTTLQSNTLFSALNKNHLGICNMVWQGYETAEIRVDYVNQVLGNYVCIPSSETHQYGTIPTPGDGGVVDDIISVSREELAPGYIPGEILYLNLLGYNPSFTAPTMQLDYFCGAYLDDETESHYIYY